jgi:hypothetical protein
MHIQKALSKGIRPSTEIIAWKKIAVPQAVLDLVHKGALED